jgi:hypothetical protein
MAPRTQGTKRNTTNKARGGNTKTSARGGGGSLQSLTLPQLRQWHKSFMQTDKLIDSLKGQQEIQKPFIQAMAKIHGQTLEFTQNTTNARGGGTNARGGNKTRAVTGRGRAQNNNQQSATG